MALARLSMKVGKAGSAGPHAAYIAREGKYAVRLERGEKLEATEAGNMPAWARSAPQTFWTAADAHERKNGTVYREMEIALPRELPPAQRVELVRAFVQQEIGGTHAYQWAIHVPKAVDGEAQPHVHLMFSERRLDGIERDPEQYFKRYNAKQPERGGARKGYGPHAGQTLSAAERAADLKALRARWEAMCNAHLERAGQAERIDMRSYAARGIERAPERKQLPSEWRGQGRANVVAFRAAQAEQVQAEAALKQVVPDARATILELASAREARRPERNPEKVDLGSLNAAAKALTDAHFARIAQRAQTAIKRIDARIERQDRRIEAHRDTMPKSFALFRQKAIATWEAVRDALARRRDDLMKWRRAVMPYAERSGMDLYPSAGEKRAAKQAQRDNPELFAALLKAREAEREAQRQKITEKLTAERSLKRKGPRL